MTVGAGIAIAGFWIACAIVISVFLICLTFEFWTKRHDEQKGGDAN